MLAWCARIERDQEVTITHGEWVETTSDSAVEGAWSGPFRTHGFGEALTFTGTGIRVLPHEIQAATPTHTLQTICATKIGRSLLLANSLAFLLASADDGIDEAYRFYDYDLMSVMDGLRRYVRNIPTRTGRGVRLYYHSNIRIRDDMEVVEERKAGPPAFAEFSDYYEFLLDQTVAVARNAEHPDRRVRYRTVTTVSSGYDSPCCAALAKAAGCREAVTFTTARPGFADRDDSGRRVAESLGMDVAEYDPAAYLGKAGCPEVEMMATGVGGDDVVYLGLEDRLPRVLLYTGYHGDRVWARTGVHPTRDIVRGDPSGGSLAEFRLRVGFVNLPVPFIGCMEHPSIHAISNSPAMVRWSLGTSYDRPIPRRIAEEAGVPRHLFGRTKKAVARPYQTTGTGPENPPMEEWLTAGSQVEFRRFVAKHPPFGSGWDRWRFELMHQLYQLNRRVLENRRAKDYLNLLHVRPPERVWVHGRYAKRRSEHMVAFHWAVGKMLQRYTAALTRDQAQSF